MINIIGAGSLGSFTTFLLAKMSGVLDAQIRVTDFDKVEMRNVQNQLYRESDVGQLKVEALRNIIKDTFGVNLITEDKKVAENIDFRGIVIVLVDNMSARQAIFDACKFNPAVEYFIDARTGESGALVFAFNPADVDWVKRYSLLLFPDSRGQAPPCATPETVPTLWAVASVISRLVVNFRKNSIFTNEFYQAIIDFDTWPSIKTEVQKDM